MRLGRLLYMSILLCVGYSVTAIGFGSFLDEPSQLDEDAQTRQARLERNEWRRFHLAICDAERAQYSEINYNLVDIVPWNHYIIWGPNKAHEKVLIVSVMPVDKLAFYLPQEAVDKMRAINEDESHAAAGLITCDDKAVEVVLNKQDFATIKNPSFQGKGLSETPTKKLKFPMKEHPFFGKTPSDIAWVSVAPELAFALKTFARENEENTTVEALRIRANQILGLWPNFTTSKVVVEHWVDPADLFRPSIDPEVFDKTALPDRIHHSHVMYNNIGKLLVSNILDEDQVGNTANSPEYVKLKGWRDEAVRKCERIGYGSEFCKMFQHGTSTLFRFWYAHEKGFKYDMDNRWAMPWTRLGYTYDYGATAFNSLDTDRHYGVSEFIIKPDAVTQIHAIYSIDRYIRVKNINSYKGKIRSALRKKVFEDSSIMQRPISMASFAITSDDRSFTVKRKLQTVRTLLKEKINAYSDLLSIIHKNKTKKQFFRVEGLDFTSKVITEAIDTVKDHIKQLLTLRSLLAEKYEQLQQQDKAMAESVAKAEKQYVEEYGFIE